MNSFHNYFSADISDFKIGFLISDWIPEFYFGWILFVDFACKFLNFNVDFWLFKLNF